MGKETAKEKQMIAAEAQLKQQEAQLPSFIETAAEPGGLMEGTELMTGYSVLSFFKVIQGNSKPPFKPPFKEGDLITVPNMDLVMESRENNVTPFVVLFSYPEYCLRNPFPEKPFVVERTFDRKSEIAAKAKSRNPKDREVPHPNPEVQKPRTYAEHLNFVISLVDHKEIDPANVIVLTFSVGEWKYGNLFLDLLKKRQRKYRTKHAFAHQFELGVSMHSSGDNSWLGIDVFNPSTVPPLVEDPQRYAMYHSMYTEIAESFRDTGITVDYESGMETYSSDDSESPGTVEGAVVSPDSKF